MLNRKVLKNKIFLFGLILLVVGSGPLIGIMAAAELGLTSDPNPNPIFFGMMAMFSFWPGFILMGIGFFTFYKEQSSKE